MPDGSKNERIKRDAYERVNAFLDSLNVESIQERGKIL